MADTRVLTDAHLVRYNVADYNNSNIDLFLSRIFHAQSGRDTVGLGLLEDSPPLCSLLIDLLTRMRIGMEVCLVPTSRPTVVAKE